VVPAPPPNKNRGKHTNDTDSSTTITRHFPGCKRINRSQPHIPGSSHRQDLRNEQDPREGFSHRQRTNKSGQVSEFYAKEYDELGGFIDSIWWDTHTLPDGTPLRSWKLLINDGEKEYVLQVGDKENPFNRLMSVLLTVDFTRPVLFKAFEGRDGRKVLLIAQDTDEDGKPTWLHPLYPERWLSRIIIDKLKQNIPLNEKEERNVARTADGKFDRDYAYIVQNIDGSWSFDTWRNFLMERMQEEVLPNVEEAAKARPKQTNGFTPGDAYEPDAPPFTGTAAAGVDDEEIPF
jgi:hypothetical protein